MVEKCSDERPDISETMLERFAAWESIPVLVQERKYIERK
jgi:hypothetical protein